MGKEETEEERKPNALADLIEVAVNENDDGSVEKKCKRPGGNNPLARAILRDMGQTASTCVSRRNSTDDVTTIDAVTKPPSAPAPQQQQVGAELDSGAEQHNGGDSSLRPHSAFSPINKKDSNSGADHSVVPTN